MFARLVNLSTEILSADRSTTRRIPPLNHVYNPASYRERILMRPEPQHGPSCGSEQSGRMPVANSVAVDLCGPIACIRLRRCMMLRASMPEAAIYEDRDLRTAEDQVSSSPNSRERPCRDAITHPHRMHRTAHSDLRLGISRSIALHHTPNRRRGSP
jgi:hypothetical protein